jgi:hypothetical protein
MQTGAMVLGIIGGILAFLMGLVLEYLFKVRHEPFTVR